MRIGGYKSIFLLAICATFNCACLNAQQLFNDGWRFAIVDSLEVNDKLESRFAMREFDDSEWQAVVLPHTAHMEPLLVNDQWQGLCWYRKQFSIENYSIDKKYTFEVEAAMNHVVVWVNGQQVEEYENGYLPLVVDLTSYLTSGENVVALRLDNRDNERTGPKPLSILDFNMYGGIYRNVWLSESSKTYITHPILANKAASGGVFVTTPEVSEQRSVVQIKTNVANEERETKDLKVLYSIYNEGQLVKQSTSQSLRAARGESVDFKDCIELDSAKLWSPDTPNLYTVKVDLICDSEVVDSEKVRFGIRKFEFRDNQLYINGKKSYLRGVNRHQEYPYIGYALSDNAQYRDAKRIKDGGFDYVRLSHYPQSPAFMDACDELGLVVVDAILGWQYYNETDAFKSHAYNSARRLIRRDRNHPCVMAWEVSLNETNMPIPFMTILDNIVHEEYPGEGVYSCGWMSDVYDIYFQARQHRIGHPERMTFEKPYMVSEYGDWEYYSTNAGLNQHQHSREKRIELSSRQLRADGEVRLLQQAYNLQEAHNDNMNIPATADSYWVMYDYNRGYHDDIESSGVMDIFRLPKFAYYFFQSQRSSEPMLQIATYWSEESPLDVRVFSNCDEVSLYLNGQLVAKQSPDENEISGNLNHPPFTFMVGEYAKGELKAVGFQNGEAVVESRVSAPKEPKSLKIWTDEGDRAAQAGCNDVIFVYVAAVDKNGTICPDFDAPISISTDSKVSVVNTDGVVTEAGIATALVRIGGQGGESTISAASGKKLKGEYRLNITE
ncbi:MAG: glycoside hydrolase family 2 TIM barrel-domain containing protein [Rikenellaceae bacterium]